MVPASGVGADGVREWIWPPASGTSGGGVICAGGGGVPLGFGEGGGGHGMCEEE